MKNWCLWTLLALLTPMAAQAGSYPASDSYIDGYFLAYQTDAYVSHAGNSQAFLEALRQRCAQQGALYSPGVRAPFTCLAAKDEDDFDFASGNLHLQLQPGKGVPIRDDRFRLYGLKPFPPAAWHIRHASDDEVRDVGAILAKRRAYAPAARSLRVGKAIVIDVWNRKETIYIVPWKVVYDGALDEKNRYYLVLTKSGAATRLRGEISGKILGYADLDGDGLPEVQTVQDCDGSCQLVQSLRDPKQRLVEVMVH